MIVGIKTRRAALRTGVLLEMRAELPEIGEDRAACAAAMPNLHVITLHIIHLYENAKSSRHT